MRVGCLISGFVICQHMRVAVNARIYTNAAWQGFQFCDPSCGVPFDEDDFDDYFSELTYTTVLSDGTILEVRGGHERSTVCDHADHALRFSVSPRS